VRQIVLKIAEFLLGTTRHLYKMAQQQRGLDSWWRQVDRILPSLVKDRLPQSQTTADHAEMKFSAVAGL
jgi:hypothetical protein